MHNVLARALRHPMCVASFGVREWSWLIRQARNAELLGQLRLVLDESGQLDKAPVEAARHLDIAWQLSLRHRQAVRWELEHIESALSKLALDTVVVLKGAAYVLTDLRAGSGRVFNDVDILVPMSIIKATESAFVDRGWIPGNVDAYDQRYYREWMHEIPPLEHKDRATVLDVHHTIVPPTSGVTPDAMALVERALPVENMFSVLSPADMVLHSAIHLFFNEFHKGLRDLYDLHCLLQQFSAESGEPFWQTLELRAREWSVDRVLYDAVRLAHRVFDTEIPESILDRLESNARRAPVIRILTDWMFEQVLLPDHPGLTSPSVRFARWLAFARSHWLRMPLPLLVYHLSRKALKPSG